MTDVDNTLKNINKTFSNTAFHLNLQPHFYPRLKDGQTRRQGRNEDDILEFDSIDDKYPLRSLTKMVDNTAFAAVYFLWILTLLFCSGDS